MNGLKRLCSIFGSVLLTTAICLMFSPNASAAPAQEGKWWRGQVHIHTNWSDAGDAVKWYKKAGYSFAIITDLNYATNVEGLQQFYGSPGRFCVIPGIELNKESPVLGDKIYDMQGYGGTPSKIKEFRDPLTNYIALPLDDSASAIYNRQGRMIRGVGGIPAIAHPNLNWSTTVDDILKTDSAIIKHLEISTAEPGMNDLGGGGHPSTEEMWDQVLSTGRILYGLAADDSHHFYDFAPQSFFHEAAPATVYPALPGRTSVFVYAGELSPREIIAAIDRGDFYAVKHHLTFPIEFKDYKVNNNGIHITLPGIDKDVGWSLPGHNNVKYRTFFIGKDGKVLKMDESTNPSYQFKGDELYVRARVECSDGSVAWTQPVFVNKK